MNLLFFKQEIIQFQRHWHNKEQTLIQTVNKLIEFKKIDQTQLDKELDSFHQEIYHSIFLAKQLIEHHRLRRRIHLAEMLNEAKLSICQYFEGVTELIKPHIQQ
jgi:mannitol/fructose-specific phosphotransferase system IIA component (Ntr-type)